MIQSTIHEKTHLGYVHLTVTDLERSTTWYQEALGFQIHRQEGDTAYLGAGRDDLLVLTGNPQARRVSHTTGLYHFAILVPSRLALAQSLQNMIDTETRIGGWSDHLVSEAIYLDDPDGNGIEIYRDRPRDTWNYDNDHVRMAVDPFDARGVLNELKPERPPWNGLEPDTVLGHIHVHVAHLAEAEAFYRDVLGFGMMAHLMGSASFVSAGGYHHHIGMNTWAGVGVPPAPEDAVGLCYFTIHLPEASECDRLVERLEAANIPYKMRDEGLFVRDPSGNGIVFVVDEHA